MRPTPNGPRPDSGAPPRVPFDNIQVLIMAVEQSPISVIITDPRGVIEYVNPMFTERMGYSREEVIGKTPRIIKGDALPREFYQQMWNTILSGQDWHGVFHNRTKDGTLLWELASISPIVDSRGQLTHFVGFKEDITELKALQDQMAHMAHHDQLTGLPNRFLFQDRLCQTLAQSKRRQSRFALLFMDLDGFKQVNDSLGHAVGDALLAAAATRIQDCVREADTAARMGGDEFTVILSDIQERANAERVAQGILAAMAAPFTLAGQECRIGVSIGIAVYPEHGDTGDALISCADHALYEVKRGARNSFRFGT